MVTDGEFNSLRTQGETRPVHIWQIIHDARESVSRQRALTLEKMLKKIGGVYCSLNVGFIYHFTCNLSRRGLSLTSKIDMTAPSCPSVCVKV